MRPPILIDWRLDFIAELAGLLVSRYGARPADVAVVFPHRRPRRFLKKALAERVRADNSAALPEIMSMEEWLSDRRALLDLRAGRPPRRMTERLDRIGLLMEIVLQLREGAVAADRTMLDELPSDPGEFHPWGARLDELMEDFFRHDRRPRALPDSAGETSPAAAALSAHLDRIFERYRGALDGEGLTTPGLEAALLVGALRGGEFAEEAGPIVFAGFHLPSRAEKLLMEALWRGGAADLVLYGDPEAARGSGHFSCRELCAWIASLGVGAETIETDKPDEPAIVFYEGFDLHSQLSQAFNELGVDEFEGSAVVLPDETALMPVLHQLPRGDINVSMGCPLAGTPMYRLIDRVLKLQETAAAGRYYWRDLIAFLRHPYVRMSPADGPDSQVGRVWRMALARCEADLRSGAAFVDPFAWSVGEDIFDGVSPEDRSSVEAAFQRLLSVGLTGFSDLHTPARAGQALSALLEALLPWRGEGWGHWSRFPVDGECLHRTATKVIPLLTGCRLAHEPVGPEAVFAIVRDALRAERVPFEAEPLGGLQVLGMLETRLLPFRKIILLDADDELLPGFRPFDPLLPEPLRAAAGLPEGEARAQVAAYNFYSLLHGAQDVRILYAGGESTGADQGVIASRGVRSRFVEQLLWREEQLRNEVVKPGVEPLRRISPSLRGMPSERSAILKTPDVVEALDRMIAEESFSARRLDTYLRCPRRFFLEYVLKIKPAEEVGEEGDPLELGRLVHDCLRNYFEPFIGLEISGDILDPQPLVDDFRRRLEAAAFFQHMPYDMRRSTEVAGEARLRRLARHQPPTVIESLESKLESELPVAGRVVSFTARLDRVDRRDDEALILDYKIGSAGKPSAGVWSDDELWDRVAQWRPEAEDDPLADLAAGLSSVQLPLYMWLYETVNNETPTAAWSEIGKVAGNKSDAPETPLLSKRTSATPSDITARFAPLMVDFLLRHMRHSDAFAMHGGDHCTYCEYKGGCSRQSNKK